MTVPPGFFQAVLEWRESAQGPVWPDLDPRLGPYRTIAQHSLIDPGLVRELPQDVHDTAGRPVWSLLYVTDRRQAAWCFVEQGRGGAFGAGGGRVSFAAFTQHPADVWRAGVEEAWTVPASAERWTPATARAVLTGIAAERTGIPLPGSPADNAWLIEGLLDVLPRRVAARWMWSTWLFTPEGPFVAGGSPRHDATVLPDNDLGLSPVTAAPDGSGGHREALHRLAGEVGRISERSAAWARQSTAERLADFLETRPPSAATPDVPAPPDQSERRAPAPSESPAARPTPRAQRRGTVPLTWVAWADIGNGFARLDGDDSPALRPYWPVAESLLEREKVPQGVDATLAHPLWTLQSVWLADGRHMWCFVERGRGIRLAADGRASRDRQFGVAGGCRFGFADFTTPAVDVWRAGAEQAWTPRGEPPAADPAALADLLAGVAVTEYRMLLRGRPATNAILIEQLLAVLPSQVAANWIWSTCLFRWEERFIAGQPPDDLRTPLLDRMTHRLARESTGMTAAQLRLRLTARQSGAFAYLQREAERSMTFGVLQPVREMVESSRATTLPELLDELVNRIPLLATGPDEPAGDLSTVDLRDVHPAVVEQWAQTAPQQARLRFSTEEELDPAVARHLVAGLLAAQRDSPTRDLLGLPQAGVPTAADLGTVTVWMLALEPALEQRAELITLLTASGGALSTYDDLVAAGSWLEQLGFTPDSHPQFFPEHLVRGLLPPDPPSEAVVAALRLVADPADLALRAARSPKRPAPRHTAAVLLGLYLALTGRPWFDAAGFDRVVGEGLRRAGRRLAARQRWLADVLRAYPLDSVHTGFQRAVLAGGGSALAALYQDRAGDDQTLYDLSRLLFPEGLPPSSATFRPARRRPPFLLLRRHVLLSVAALVVAVAALVVLVR